MIVQNLTNKKIIGKSYQFTTDGKKVICGTIKGHRRYRSANLLRFLFRRGLFLEIIDGETEFSNYLGVQIRVDKFTSWADEWVSDIPKRWTLHYTILPDNHQETANGTLELEFPEFPY